MPGSLSICLVSKWWHFPKSPTWEQQLVSLASLPGCQKLNELVCLLIHVSSRVHVFHLLGHLGEVPTAASQTDAGGGGTGTEPRVWHWWWLVLPEEVKATWCRIRLRWSVLGRAHVAGRGEHTDVLVISGFWSKHWSLALAMIKRDSVFPCL